VTAFGRVSASSETVAAEAAAEARDYLSCPAPVGCHLADQLILPMALAAGGTFMTGRPSLHMLTNIDVVCRFLDVSVKVDEIAAGQWSVVVETGGSPIAGP
jgi:RNA 3'-terminal phosphate cyclase (ATP)